MVGVKKFDNNNQTKTTGSRRTVLPNGPIGSSNDGVITTSITNDDVETKKKEIKPDRNQDVAVVVVVGGGNRNKNKNKNDVITTKTTNQPADIGTSTSSHKNSVHNPVKKKGGDGGSVSPLIEGEGRLQKRFSTTSFHIFLLLWLLFLSFFFVMDCSREAPGGGEG